MPALDSLNCCRTLQVGKHTYHYYSLPEAGNSLGDIARLPLSLKVLLENLLRWEDGRTVRREDCQAIADWLRERRSEHEIQYRPARVLMQDFTGVPAVVDLAAMRDATARAGGDPRQINPQIPVDLVIDHSVMVDRFADPSAFADNVAIEMQRNAERYAFLRWGQQAFANFRVVPPGTGICHQVNLEYLADVVRSEADDGRMLAFPDSLVGTDSHTTMINGLGVLGWGVGGIEAEAAMLGQPVSMLIPEVVGVRLTGRLREGVTATDLVLTVTQMLRKHGVVGKFVEFYGPGLDALPLADRATISNMAPEYGATCGFFPVDRITLDYLRLTGRDASRIALVEAYCRAQGLWRDSASPEPEFSEALHLDLDSVQPSLAGPKRPQDRVNLPDMRASFDLLLETSGRSAQMQSEFPVQGESFGLRHGAVVIAAITSCTNTSNPSVLMASGLLAKKAVERGLQRKPWVKSSLAPGSKVVTDYLEKAGFTPYLERLGFYLVGYGCTTCIGNSGPLPDPIAQCITDQDLIVCSVLSGNRNFEGRVHPQVKANWLASPPLVVAFALAGTTRIDLLSEPLGHDPQGQPVYLRDLWPSDAEVAAAVGAVEGEMFRREYADVFSGDEAWRSMPLASGDTYAWDPHSSYVQHPPYFKRIDQPLEPPADILGARILALFGDSITTDHISPAGNIKATSPAGLYLQSLGIAPRDFNSYGSRRGNHEVMMRGTFANIRIRNEMLAGEEGGYTLHHPGGEKLSIYDAAMRYQREGVPLVVIAGQEYGTGSSRDWAAKGTNLLGIKAVIAESFERIHRSNLIGMGVLALQFMAGQNRHSLGLTGDEVLNIRGLSASLAPRQQLTVDVTRRDGSQDSFPVLCRIDTQNEVDYFMHGGILHFVLRERLGSP
ncbi:aconitate hydratase AcnA [Pseudomonas flexibilis]|uniref:Aconitate hydratase n=1 Tax=Pseudomonas flexibilis TaxID=706570 RepID=A0A0B3BZP4_9PSED|nr:aconitate hydratase AcnA [Pseudomonas flexibilis]KHO66571.1 aconitate hydratase [Pseudomonas flexibilis]SCY32824.1 aconitate hydratase [Pseudomonas flexibilis]